MSFTKAIKKNLTRAFVIVFTATALISCGGSGGSGPGGPGGPGSYLMGGSIQGLALDFSAVVTTFAGTASSSGSADGTGAAALFSSPDGIVSDGTNLFVVDSANQTIRRIVIATGAVTTFAGTAGFMGSTDGTGAAARFNYPAGIATDGTNLYVADSNNHTIRQVVIATGVVTTLAGTAGTSGSADGTGALARFNNPYGITVDGANLYVVDSSNHTIRQIVIATGVVTTLAGTAGSSGSADGTGAAARFNNPVGITNDGTNLYVSDWTNNTIRQIVIGTGVVTTLAGTAGASGSADGIGAAAGFRRPFRITTDGSALYVADSANHTVRRIVINTAVVTTIAGTAPSSGTTDGAGAAARFNYPNGITLDGTNLFVAESSNHTIRKITLPAVTTFAGSAGLSGSADGTGAAARFWFPTKVTTDGSNIYVADFENHTIRQIVISTGVVTTIAGTATVFGFTDGTGAAALFYEPLGITTDGTNLYVLDSRNHTIRQIVIATGVVTTLAGTVGVWGSADGTGVAAQFNSPDGITTDGTNLYVADSGNDTIRQVNIATGVVTTLAGTADTSGSNDGTGAAALFNRPRGITTDGTNLYVADTYNHTIRKIVIATGVVTTIAGTANAGSSADGTGAAARFNRPNGITMDGTNLFVADTYNRTVRQIVIATGVVTTLAGSASTSGSTDGTTAAARFNQPYDITTDGTSLFVADSDNHTIRQID